jgi:hypothetical protein
MPRTVSGRWLRYRAGREAESARGTIVSRQRIDIELQPLEPLPIQTERKAAIIWRTVVVDLGRT